ncbi:hypothetical protein [Occallatibacter savannae]|uniref:hypothetical protein n=1 Tax=Occallatibacter savannae TaxID=1002691 RepID=UPI0013A54B20|nr:hypothetical protein [Occallatibacter savannae]
MRGHLWWAGALVALAMAVGAVSCTAQAPDNFRWVDFHSPNDQDVVNWVRRALEEQKWTAIREIGVEYDQALVITTNRNSPQGAPNRDSFSMWSVSLANHAVVHIVDGTNLRIADWLLLDVTSPRELGVLYDDCADCDATTYFTTLHYDLRQHAWAARWLQGGGKTIAVWSAKAPLGVTQTQVFAVLADSNGHEVLGTWRHLDYGAQRAAEDLVYRYDVDSGTARESNLQLFGRDAASMKERLCHGDTVPGLRRGQDSALCSPAEKPTYERKPVTTPPKNNEGRSRPQ